MPEFLVIAILTFVASLVGTLTGFGTSTIMVPVLVLLLPLPQALLFVGIIHWFGDIWKIVLFKQGVDWRLIVTFGLPGVLAAYLGAKLAIQTDASMVRALGLVLVVIALYSLFKPKLKLEPSNTTAIGGGVVSGFLAGSFGVGGAVRAAALSVYRLPKAVFLATNGAVALAIDSARLITYGANRINLESKYWYSLLLLIPISWLGAQAAEKLVIKTTQHSFRIIVGIFLIGVGIKLLFFP